MEGERREPRAERRQPRPAGSAPFDDALAETIIGLFRTEVIRRRGPWRSIDDVEMATLDWVAWFNRDRLLSSIGNVPPLEFDQAYLN